MIHPIINIAIKAARNARKNILRAYDSLEKLDITEKSENNFVTDADKQSEQDIIQVILDSYPDHCIIGEESGKHSNTNTSSEYTWVIDPIDGTNNFLRGNPHFSISIGVLHKNVIEHGLIYDPLRQELFTATKGGGAFLNNKRIRVGSRKTLKGSTVAYGFGNKTTKNFDIFLKTLENIFPQTAGSRITGSAALDFAYVACGRLDGLFEMNLSPWDMAAGLLIVSEAGGVTGDFTDTTNCLETGNVIAGNINIFNTILQATQPKR